MTDDFSEIRTPTFLLAPRKSGQIAKVLGAKRSPSDGEIATLIIVGLLSAWILAFEYGFLQGRWATPAPIVEPIAKFSTYGFKGGFGE